MKRRSYLCIILAAILWGGIGVFFNILSNLGFTQMQVVTIRVTSAAITLVLYIIIKDPSLLKIKLRDCWCFVGTGIISLVFFNWCYFTAIKMTSLAVAAVLMYTSPIFVMLFSIILFQEKINSQKIIALIITFTGCILVTGIFQSFGNKLSMLGILIGLGSGIGYALYSIFGRYAIKKGYNSITISAYTFIFATMGSLPISGIWKNISLLVGNEALFATFGIGVLCCVFPFILYTKGLMNVENSKAAIIATIEPAVAAMLSSFLYGEKLLNSKGLGIIFVFSSVILLNLEFKDIKDTTKE